MTGNNDGYAPKDLAKRFTPLQKVQLPEGNIIDSEKALFFSRRQPVFIAEVMQGKNPWRQKFQSDWFVKSEIEEEQAMSEVVIADAFRVMMPHEDLAPKVRVGILGDKKYTLSKKIPDFQVAISFGTAHPDGGILPPFIDYADKINLSSLENYYHAMAVGFALGQWDMHPGNWGVVLKNGKRWVAVVDHGRSIKDGHIENPETNLVNFFLNGPSADRIINREFIAALLTVANEIESKKDNLKVAFTAGVARAKSAKYAGADALTAQSLLNDIDKNIISLRTCAFALELQIALQEKDATTFKRLLSDARFPRVADKWHAPEGSFKLMGTFEHCGDYSLELIKDGTYRDVTEAPAFEKLKEAVYLSHKFYFARQNEYFRSTPDAKCDHTLVTAVYNTFSPHEKKIVYDEVEELRNFFQTCRNAYFDAKERWGNVEAPSGEAPEKRPRM